MPFPPFPYLFFSSQPAESHRTSTPVDVSEMEMLFLLLHPKGNLYVVDPSDSDVSVLSKLFFLSHICGKPSP